MKRAGIIIGGLVGTLALVWYVLFYPHPMMRSQPNVRPYKAPMPVTPAGTVPVGEPQPVVRIDRSPESEAWGKVYYGYYCLSCHGPTGDGDGPVGQSYTPDKPTDLRVAKVRACTDKQLLEKMLTGAGHAPVLVRIVPPEHRWPLVWYIRSLASATQPQRD